MTNRKLEYRVIPPESDAEFVAHMEAVLALYAKPYEPKHPVIMYGRAAGSVTQRSQTTDRRHSQAWQAYRL